jgi:hypothetical protein
MKMVDDGDTWAHVACAIWVPEPSFGDHRLRQPVVGIENVPRARWQLVRRWNGFSSVIAFACIISVILVAFVTWKVSCRLDENILIFIHAIIVVIKLFLLTLSKCNVIEADFI